jgi:hypothetical protein
MSDFESISEATSSLDTGRSNAGNSAFSVLRQAGILDQTGASLAAQLLTVRPEDLDVAQSIDLPVLRLDGKRYILESWIHKKRRRGESWITAYGTALIQLNEHGRNSGRFWLCDLCDRRTPPKVEMFSLAATSSAMLHLRKIHSITKDNNSSLDDNHNLETDSSSPAISVLDLQRRAAEPRPLIVKSRAAQFQRLLLRWIADANIPLVGVEHPYFRQMLVLLDADFVNKTLPKSDTTIKRWIMTEYNKGLSIVKSGMNTAMSKIHTSFDLWTSPNGIAILSMVGHYIDRDGRPQTRLLALERVQGSHSGENQAIYLHKTVVRYGIEEHLGFFTADNADSCDACVRSLLRAFNPIMPQRDADILSAQRRIRCFGHIVNLIAKSFLEGDSSDIFDQSWFDADKEAEIARRKEWRKRGAIGKCHNTNHFIRRSPQRRDQFLSITTVLTKDELAELGIWYLDDDLKGLMVKGDNDTRWNSVLLMVLRTLKLRQVIQAYYIMSLGQNDKEKRIPQEDCLQDDDWLLLSEIAEILQPLLYYTKHFEGRAPRFAEVIIALDNIHKHFNLMRARYSNNLIPEPFRAPRPTLDEPALDCIAVAAVTPSRTVSAEEEVVIGPSSRSRRNIQLPSRYRDSVVDFLGSGYGDVDMEDALEPTPEQTDEHNEPAPNPASLSDDGLHFLQHCFSYAIAKTEKYQQLIERDSVIYWAAMILHPAYGSRWIELERPERHNDILRDFRTYFDQYYPTIGNAPSGSGNAPWHQKTDLLGVRPDFYRKRAPEPRNELQAYLDLTPVEDFESKNLFSWWELRKGQFPRLFNMAMDILAIPAMSSENERAFSTAKLILSSQRHSLQFETVQALQCLKMWARDGAFNWDSLQALGS